MVDAAWGGAGDADVVALLVDAAKGLDEEVERILDRLKDTRMPLVLVLNKIDRVKKERLLELAQQCNARAPFTDTFMISALDGDGVADFKAYLARTVPAGPLALSRRRDHRTRPCACWPPRSRARRSSSACTTSCPTRSRSRPPPGWSRRRAFASSRPSSSSATARRRIVLGNGGRTIRQLSMESRKELAEIVEKPVHLFLFVKVRENWGDDPERYRELGLTFPKD